jgi:hypothetical protein
LSAFVSKVDKTDRDSMSADQIADAEFEIKRIENEEIASTKARFTSKGNDRYFAERKHYVKQKDKKNEAVITLAKLKHDKERLYIMDIVCLAYAQAQSQILKK